MTLDARLKLHELPSLAIATHLDHLLQNCWAESLSVIDDIVQPGAGNVEYGHSTGGHLVVDVGNDQVQPIGQDPSHVSPVTRLSSRISTGLFPAG